MNESDANEFIMSLQRLGEDFMLHFRIASERYRNEGFAALIDMVRNAPHEFPDKAKKVYQAASVAFMLRCPDEMKQFNEKMLEACPGDENIKRLAADLQQTFDATDREVEAIKRRGGFKVIKS